MASSLVIGGIILGIGLTRYLGPVCCLTPTRPPQIHALLIAILIGGAITARAYQARTARRALAGITIIAILMIFAVIKSPTLGQITSAGLRFLRGQDASLAQALDLRWIGYSYLAFRLLHVLRDYQNGKRHDLSLEEFVVYTLFPPAITAGPIDRAARFANDLRKEERPKTQTMYPALQRILWGAFKKFALADSLALVALNDRNALQITSPTWLWVLLYAYSLRIYLDFAGYTDIAIGLGALVGIQLPENFRRPYLQTNLAQFWNSWHITLAQWFRAYFFNPLTRFLRASASMPSAWLVILIGQFSTMLLIGLWHGLTWNFAIWGLWHGVGLFVHNRWSSWRRARPHSTRDSGNPARKGGSLLGWFFTFNYVTLGWVWFALPSPQESWQVFTKLFQIG